MKNIHLRLLAVFLLMNGFSQAAPGDTRVAKWRGDKTAAFMIFLDDGWPSQWQIAVPELAKRGLVATIYINPEKGEFKKFEEIWLKEIPLTGMVYANHTMSHQGVKDMENAEHEIGGCAEYIRSNTTQKGLLSYGQPGVGEGKWNISGPELATLLVKHGLISRGTMDGHMAVYHLKTTGEMLALADKAIETKGAEYLTIHGIERIKEDWGYQDFWALDQAVFLPLLDGLKERSDAGDLWITDHISQYKYEVQRDAATAKVLRKNAKGIELELACSADAKLYDGALTLVTDVPVNWKKASVKQGETSSVIEVKNGVVIFDAFPGKILLTGE